MPNNERFHLGFDGISRRIRTATINGESFDYVRYRNYYAVRPMHLDSMLAAAYYTVGWGALNITQGGLSRTVAASARTHFNLDVVDISVRNRPRAMVWDFCDNLFETGNLPFPRGYARDSFQNNKHIHNLWWPCDAGHPQLQQQYYEYNTKRGDGLVGNSPYTGPDNPILYRWRDSMFNPVNRQDVPGIHLVDTDYLLGLDRDRRKKIVRPRGAKIKSIARVYRWGRWNRLTAYGTFYAEAYLK